VIPTYHFIISIGTISLTTGKELAEIYGYFLAKEINTTEGGIMGLTVLVQIMIPLEDRKCRVFCLGC